MKILADFIKRITHNERLDQKYYDPDLTIVHMVFKCSKLKNKQRLYAYYRSMPKILWCPTCHSHSCDYKVISCKYHYPWDDNYDSYKGEMFE